MATTGTKLEFCTPPPPGRECEEEEGYAPGSTRPDDHPDRLSATGGSIRSGSSRKSRRRKGRRAMPARQKTYGNRAAAWLEPRILTIATGVTLMGVLLYVVAISTNSWLIVDNPVSFGPGNKTGTLLLEAYTGLWKLCKVELRRTWDTARGQLVTRKHEECVAHDFFPSEEDIQNNQDYDSSYLDFDVRDLIQIDHTRTAIAFTIIALCIMAMGHGFAIYALRRPRYIIKRLAALLHFMTAACLLVLNEVFVKTVEHERDSMSGKISEKAETHYGYSFVLSWLVFVGYVLAGLAFLFMSHKRKAEFAGDVVALEDEPMEIRR